MSSWQPSLRPHYSCLGIPCSESVSLSALGASGCLQVSEPEPEPEDEQVVGGKRGRGGADCYQVRQVLAGVAPLLTARLSVPARRSARPQSDRRRATAWSTSCCAPPRAPAV